MQLDQKKPCYLEIQDGLPQDLSSMLVRTLPQRLVLLHSGMHLSGAVPAEVPARCNLVEVCRINELYGQ
jgi:hypothetical protein